MDDAMEASTQRVRPYHLRRPLAGSRNLRVETAGNTVSETVPNALKGDTAGTEPTHPERLLG